MYIYIYIHTSLVFARHSHNPTIPRMKCWSFEVFVSEKKSHSFGNCIIAISRCNMSNVGKNGQPQFPIFFYPFLIIEQVWGVLDAGNKKKGKGPPGVLIVEVVAGSRECFGSKKEVLRDNMKKFMMQDHPSRYSTLAYSCNRCSMIWLDFKEHANLKHPETDKMQSEEKEVGDVQTFPSPMESLSLHEPSLDITISPLTWVHGTID